MLTEILATLHTGKIYSLGEIAAHFNTDIAFVLAQLEYLERQGYIQRVVPNPGCCPGCPGCQGGNHTAIALPVRWELTIKTN